MIEVLDRIKKISENQPEQEVCGFLLKNKKIFEAENVAISKDDSFEIKASDYMKCGGRKKIYAIYHSHPFCSEEFSKEDVGISEALMIPIIVYSIIKSKFNIYIPKSVKRNKTINSIEKSVVTY
jgi:proteasome lid subunit RPN8/RPN11